MSKRVITASAVRLTKLDHDGHPVGETEELRGRVQVELDDGDGGYWERLAADMQSLRRVTCPGCGTHE